MKKGLKKECVLLFGVYAVYGCLFTPLYRVFSTDVVLRDTIGLDLIDLAFQWLEVIGLSLVCGCLVSAVSAFGIGGAKRHFGVAAGALAFKYISSLLTVSVVNGSFDATENYLGTLLSFLLEAAVAALSVFFFVKKSEKSPAAAAPEISLRGDHPARFSLLLSCALILLLRTVSFVMEEVAYGLLGVSYSVSDVPVSLVYWLALALVPSGIGYFLSLFYVRKNA